MIPLVDVCGEKTKRLMHFRKDGMQKSGRSSLFNTYRRPEQSGLSETPYFSKSYTAILRRIFMDLDKLSEWAHTSSAATATELGRGSPATTI